MSRRHQYSVELEWTGNRGDGTRHYTAYERDFVARVSGKPSLEGSADPAFRGDAGRWNPEDMLVASVSACHKLWQLTSDGDAQPRICGKSRRQIQHTCRHADGQQACIGECL